MEEKYIVALEVGSSKIKGAIGTVDPTGALSVRGVEEEKVTDSVRYGYVRNTLDTTMAIRNVLNRLEMREPQRKIKSVYLSVGGRSLMSQDIEVERRLPHEMEITAELIGDITSEALNHPLPDRTVVGVSPKEFRVDNLPATRAVGTFGSHISARLNLISCRSHMMRYLNMVVDERLHLGINDVFVRPLAEADLVLYPEEKRQGCMLVDCGADTTTVAIYKNGVLMYLSTIPMGSRHITRDITALNYLEERAEDLKIEGGNALLSTEAAGQSSIPGVDFTQINNYVAARAGEIIANINEQIKYAGLTADKLPAGIILVGRGAKLHGFDRRLENVTTMKVRYGSPVNRIRILDGRLNGTDHVDVLAILMAASKEKEVVECMERTAPDYGYTSPYQPQTPTPETPANDASYGRQPYGQPQGGQQPLYPQGGNPTQQTAHEDPRHGQQPTTPVGGYPYHAGQQGYQPPRIQNNPYAGQAAGITASTGQTKDPEQERTTPAPKKPNWYKKTWNTLCDRMVGLMTEPIDDDDPDNDKDN